MLNLSNGPNRVVQSSREVIEHKLLAALDNPDCVAIFASKEDLDLLIESLRMRASPRALEFAQGLEQLRYEAFGESNKKES